MNCHCMFSMANIEKVIINSQSGLRWDKHSYGHERFQHI